MIPCDELAITVDFVRDYANLQKQSLLADGVKLTGQETDDEVLLLAQKYAMRRIPATPRRILTASSFSVPGGLEAAMAMVTKEIQTGADLRPRLSKRILKPCTRDDMLADFGIHHLHLGTSFEADGFYKQQDMLLYARFTDTDAYFLTIKGHGEWYAQEFIAIIDREWPESIARFRLPVIDVERGYSDSERKELRNGNVDALIRLEKGKIYMSPGGGLSTDGTPTHAAIAHMQALKELRRHQDREIANARELLSREPARSTAKISLVLESGALKVHIKISRAASQR